MPGTPGTYGYCVPSDCDTLLTGFIENYYGTGTQGTSDAEADINAEFRRMNDRFEGFSMVKSVPLPLEGSTYPQTIVDANASWTVFRRLRAVHAAEFNEGVPEWISRFEDMGNEYLDEIRTGKVVFESFTALGEVGIGMPAAGTGTDSTGTFFNNWEGFAGPFWGDRRMNWRVEIESDGSTGISTFKYSIDKGASWMETGVKTGTGWIGIGYGVNVRFEGWDGTAFADGDYWDFETVPAWVTAYGDPGIVKVREGVRG